ncbi:unnamed protein product [Brugia timori]|uniref:Uncharacterized protein n=1 Tax=Brugia timori TaxID=42155 RepID=A0A0R3QJF3_9BILA|nr:unnamed protein product [Brugia timori]
MQNFYRSYLSVTMCDKEIEFQKRKKKFFPFFLEKNYHWKKFFQTIFELLKKVSAVNFILFFSLFSILEEYPSICKRVILERVQKERQRQAVTMIVRRWATNGTAIPTKISMQLG